jgi:hypothetical protein
MQFPAAITAAVLERVLVFLAPLFLDALTGDRAAARQAAADTLFSYGARTDRELRLVALTIAFSFGALDSLSRAADPVLPVNQVMRLRGNANALNRAAVQNENRLDKLHRQPPVAAEIPAETIEDLPLSSATPDLVAYARAAVQAMMTGDTRSALPAAKMTRQQRRVAERNAAKRSARQEEDARRAKWANDRVTPVTQFA